MQIKLAPKTVHELSTELERYPSGAQVICGPGYMGPKLEYHPRRFGGEPMIEFGIFSADKNPDLRPEIVPEVTVEEFMKLLAGIPGSTRECWKGGDVTFVSSQEVYIGLEGEVGLAVVGTTYSKTYNVVSILTAEI